MSSPRQSDHAEPSYSSQQRMEMQSRYGRIGDNYENLEQVTQALMESGLESSNLIVGIDFTESNEWTGRYSFNGRCLHGTFESLNPYEHAISIIGRTLSAFNEDNLIPCFGFGDGEIYDMTFSHFKSLHTLTLMSYHIKELPDSVKGLIHVRYLNISYTRVRYLPNSIGELYHLQTLWAKPTMLPSTLKYLFNLWHLHVPDYTELLPQ